MNPPRRITSRTIAEGRHMVRDLGGRPHVLFNTYDVPRNRWTPAEVNQREGNRVLFVFLTPSDGPAAPEDWALLLRKSGVGSGYGVTKAAAVYLFTAEGCDKLDAWRDMTNRQPLGRAAIRAGLRWLQNPGFHNRTGRVVLCYGQPWKTGTAARVLDEVLADLWHDLRAFGYRASGLASPPDKRWPLNPLDERTPLGLDLAMVSPADNGPQPPSKGRPWWVLE